MRKKDHVFSGKRLKELIENSGLSIAEFSNETGIQQAIIRNFINGRTDPELDHFVKMADVLGVKADYLLNRGPSYSEEQMDRQQQYILFTLSQRQNIEEDCQGDKITDLKVPYKVHDRIEPMHIMYAVWPYNLIDDIESRVSEEEKICIPLNEDQIRGLKAVIEGFHDKERDILLLHYRDGLPYSDIGDRYKVTRQYIHQIISDMIARMRHPSMHNLIRYGHDGCMERQEKEDLEKEIDLLRTEEQSLRTEYERLETKRSGAVSAVIDRNGSSIMFRPVESLGLSTRTENSIKKCRVITGDGERYITTVGDLIRYIAEGGIDTFKAMHGVGYGAVEDVEACLQKAVGMGIHDIEKAEKIKNAG